VHILVVATTFCDEREPSCTAGEDLQSLNVIEVAVAAEALQEIIDMKRDGAAEAQYLMNEIETKVNPSARLQQYNLMKGFEPPIAGCSVDDPRVRLI
jgi:hypothetical protein